MVVHAKQESIYPMVTLNIHGNNFDFFCDNMSGRSYVTNDVVKILGLRINTKEIPLSTGGFGGSRSNMDKTVTLKLAPVCIITFNVTEKIADDVGGVLEQIYKIWQGLKKYQNRLAAPIPRERSEVNVLLGINDLVRFKGIGGYKTKTLVCQSIYDDTIEK